MPCKTAETGTEVEYHSGKYCSSVLCKPLRVSCDPRITTKDHRLTVFEFDMKLLEVCNGIYTGLEVLAISGILDLDS